MANVVIFTGYTARGFYLNITPPAGAYRMRTVVEDHGYSLIVVDYVHLWTPDEIIEFLNIQTDLLVIGFSTTFYNVAPGLLRSIKDQFQTLPIVLGGPDARPEDIPDVNLVDHIFYGCSETAFITYLDYLTKKHNNPLPWSVHPRTGNLYLIADKTIPHTDTSDLRIKWKPSDQLHGIALPIETSRGCIFRCTFCAFPLLGKKKLDYLRSIDSMAEEFSSNYEMFGTTVYNFMDDTFNDTIQKLETVHAAIRLAGVKIKFCCYLRADLLAAIPEQMDLLLEMGLVSAVFGIESMDEAARKRIGKGLTNSKLLDVIDTFKGKTPNRRLRLASGFIVGLPGESVESVIRTHSWLNEQNGRYLDYWRFSPLFIARKNIWLTSQFSRDAEKFGYTFKDDSIKWTSDIMDFDTANSLAQSFNNDRANISPAEFTISELLSYGFDLDDLCEMDYQYFDATHSDVILQARATMVRQYKDRMLGRFNMNATKP